MKLANEWDGNLAELMNGYNYQPTLTKKLDGIATTTFDQSLVNEIVLWKVNRYAPLSSGTLDTLNELSNLEYRKHRDSKQTIEKMLGESGVDLPMASTLLRFKNPKVFQIIDRHAFRALYGEDYPLYSGSGVDKKINLYFDYIDKLIELSDSKKIEFHILDRVLYVFDKQHNGKL